MITPNKGDEIKYVLEGHALLTSAGDVTVWTSYRSQTITISNSRRAENSHHHNKHTRLCTSCRHCGGMCFIREAHADLRDKTMSYVCSSECAENLHKADRLAFDSVEDIVFKKDEYWLYRDANNQMFCTVLASISVDWLDFT